MVSQSVYMPQWSSMVFHFEWIPYLLPLPGQLWAYTTSSIKQEVHDISQCSQEVRAMARQHTENLGKFGHVGPQICKWTFEQTRSLQYSAHLVGGGASTGWLSHSSHINTSLQIHPVSGNGSFYLSLTPKSQTLVWHLINMQMWKVSNQIT